MQSAVKEKVAANDAPKSAQEELGALQMMLLEKRGFFVVPFVLPISLVYDAWFNLRAWMVMKFYSAPKLHAKRVEFVSDLVKKARKKNDGTRLCTARGGWQSISPGYRSYKSNCTQIPVNMYDITEFNPEKRTVKVEPYVNMGQLSHFLIPKGYTIAVLPEMDDLTVGGLYMGVGIETSSHKYGLFNDIVVEAEVILASGEVATCSREKNRDLFDALPWSYGTLGFLTSCTLAIIPCKPYVRVEYVPCRTLEEGVRCFREASESQDPPEFVEGIAYSKDEMVIMKGDFCSEKDACWRQRNAIGWWFKPWFYKHVESKLNPKLAADKLVEYIPLRDWNHRHTKSIFWELDQILQPFDGNHPVFRFLLGWLVPPKVSFLKLTQTEALDRLYNEQHVIQDMLVPTTKMAEALKVFKKEYDLYPLWLCPYRAYSYADSAAPHRYFLKEPLELNAKDKESGAKYEMYVDLGAYGVPKAVLDKKPFDAEKTGRRVEHYVQSVHGFQMLYANSYLTHEEFRTMFDHRHYDAMKQKYDPSSAFPTIYDKVCKPKPKVANSRKNSSSHAGLSMLALGVGSGLFFFLRSK
eukprot:TRINITY_DN21236_c0_g2_i1.p1 TRINITY_DN21236_c0_g2~~TRINITY_DN21236_c0_g2_i1.p1  ORF type:complete len:580 (-),score=103.68 TRINITY_DN21236_c0_g2_i1:201-1940(-)